MLASKTLHYGPNMGICRYMPGNECYADLPREPGMNLAESVRQRLLNLAKSRNETFDLILTQYGLERLLYRISQSEWKENVFLKGALLFSIWHDSPHRSTKDIDLLGWVFPI